MPTCSSGGPPLGHRLVTVASRGGRGKGALCGLFYERVHVLH